jgi:hypothetical protein
VLVTPLAVVSLALVAQVDVRSTTNCPSARDVSEHLMPLLPKDAYGDADSEDAEVTLLGTSPDGASELLIRLSDAARTTIGERRVSLRGSCSDMAEFVAAIFAAWKIDPSASIPRRLVLEDRSERASQPRRKSPFETWIGAGVGVATVGGVAAAGNLEARVGRAASSWQLRLSVAGETNRRFTLASGQVDWQHTSASLGIAWRRRHPSWVLSVDAGGVAGWATLTGQQFPDSRQARTFEYGATTGVRAGRRWGRWALWLEARPTLWATRKNARVTTDGGAQTEELPLGELVVGLGLSATLSSPIR